jgi:hypothetical protein
MSHLVEQLVWDTEDMLRRCQVAGLISEDNRVGINRHD